MAAFRSFVLPPKSVDIVYGGHPYWKLSPMPNSRFAQKAELLEVCWLQIQGTFDTAVLDKDTTYSVLYLLKHNGSPTCLGSPAEVSLSEKDGKTICSRHALLSPGSPDLIKQEEEEWLALEIGRFQPSGVTREIKFNMLENSSHWKDGLVFAGVEIRAVST